MKILAWTLSAVIGLAAVLLALVYLLPGYDLYVVRSDSMKPVFCAGDMVFVVAPGSPLSASIAPGTVVTYRLGNERITHRVLSVGADTVITKGDANEEPDARPVQLSQIEGVYRLRIPFVGRLSAFMQTKIGWFLLVILPAAALLVLIVKEIIKEALRSDNPKGSVQGQGGGDTRR